MTTRARIDTNVSVNVSSKQFFGSDLQRVVSNAVAENGIAPVCLTLELTESLLVDNTETVIRMLNQLRELGPKISIDDFGTGYSSLSYLKLLPVDELKVDRAFIMDIDKSRQDQALVKATIFLAHEFGLKVVAEGVEERQQLDFLAKVHCDEYQGFFFARPAPVEEVTQLLATEVDTAV